MRLRPDRRRPRRGRALRLGVALAVAAGLAWWAREPLLAAVGDAVVAEDEPMHADVAVASLSDARTTAFEAARLHRDGWVRKVVVFTWWDSKLDRTMRDLGVPVLTPDEASVAILERLGVPPEAIEVRAEPVNGTGAEIAALAALARERGLGGVVYVTARSHSARARWMLGRALAPGTAIAVRAPREDSFDPDGWWRSRDDARELLAEIGRWANVVVLRDAWSSPPSSALRADAR
ncbi:MAG: hypothetical protein ACKO2K_19825 [Alphaproteobacteria bacterium]